MATNSHHDETWRLLHERLRGIAKRRAALDAEEARYLREADDTRLWRRFGYVHMNEYLERELGYGPQVGTERLRVAHALAGLPLIEASLAEGVLPYSAVRELTRVATGQTERAWLDQVRGKNLRQIEALVSGRKPGDGPEDPTNPDLENQVVRLELAPAVFALFRQVQRAMADEHGGRLDDSALMESLCRQALAGSGASERPAHQIAITVCESCARGWQNGAGREIEVGPEVIARAQCDAELIGSLTAARPARVTATVTPRIRRQVLARDHHRCTAPGCRSARNLDLHHIVYQRDGGDHELWNMTVLCSGHHQQLHDGALAISGKAPDALEFVWRERREDGVGAAVIDRDAREALLAAGYKSRQARAAVEQARPHVGADATLEQVGREALRRCAASGGLSPLMHAKCCSRGSKSHETRAAVEQAGPHVGADATLSRWALKRCDAARRRAVSLP
jgi:RuvA, C-terminal domain